MICQHDSIPGDLTLVPYLGALCPACLDRISQPQLLDGVIPARSLRHLAEAHAASHQRWLTRFLEKCREAVN